MFNDYFQIGPIPSDAMYGSYDLKLVFLSFLVATFASYIALDMAGRLRDENNTRFASLCWLFGGAFAMGAGIWSMHFIGMLAFKMSMPMSYDPFWTLVSMAVAILASFIALSLLMGKTIRSVNLIIGGLFLGIAIAAMHYTGMYAMTDSMIIRYLPGMFILSIIIAIVAAEAALWLAIKSNQGILRVKIRLKIISAIVMGTAICGMHYTGMAAAIFLPMPDMVMTFHSLDPNMLSISIAGVTFLILGIAFALSTYKEIKNQQVITTARLAGMAEVSSNVLHSVGNVLNSLNVSAYAVGERIQQVKLAELSELSDLLQKNKNNLVEFFTLDERGAKIPNYLLMLAQYWQTERADLLTEIQSVIVNIQHIKDIISTQQSLGSFISLEQPTEIQTVIDEAITITGISLSTHTIKIAKEFEPLNSFLLDKIKLMQILVNLLRNSKDSLVMSEKEEKIITLRLKKIENNNIMLQVIDNGVGIDPNIMNRIFTHGFTTKPSGHGYGLHSSAILAKQMEGSLNCVNLGLGIGAEFTLILPYKIKKN